MQFSLYSFGCSTLLKILVQWQKKIESFHQYMYDKKLLIWSWLLQNIVFCQLCLTDQLFALTFQVRKIIDLLSIHISPYSVQPYPSQEWKIEFHHKLHSIVCSFLHTQAKLFTSTQNVNGAGGYLNGLPTWTTPKNDNPNEYYLKL